MVVIVSRDLDLARRVGEVLNYKRNYIVSASDEKDLRYKLHQMQPHVVILDVQFGSSAYRAIGAVPRIMLARSQPRVIALLPFRRKSARDEALKLGCFEVIETIVPSFPQKLSALVALAVEARLGTLRRADPPPKSKSVH